MAFAVQSNDDIDQPSVILFDDLWSLSPMTRAPVIKLLTKIFGSIIEDPANEKFRRINMKALTKKFAKAPAANQLLELAGFLSLNGTHLVLSESNIGRMDYVRGLFEQRKQFEEDKLAQERARIAGESRAREDAFITQALVKRTHVVNRDRDDEEDREIRRKRRAAQPTPTTNVAPSRVAPGGNNPWNQQDFAANRLEMGSRVPEYRPQPEENPQIRLIHTIERVQMVLLSWLRPFGLDVHGDVLLTCSRFVLWPCDFVFDNEADQSQNLQLTNLRHTVTLVNDTSTIIRASPWLREGEWRVRFRIDSLGRSGYVAVGVVTTGFKFDKQEVIEEDDGDEDDEMKGNDDGDGDEDVVVADATGDDDNEDEDEDDEDEDMFDAFGDRRIPNTDWRAADDEDDDEDDYVDEDEDDSDDSDYDMRMGGMGMGMGGFNDWDPSKPVKNVDLTQDVYQAYRDWYEYLSAPPPPGPAPMPMPVLGMPGMPGMPGMGMPPMGMPPPVGAPPPLPPGMIPGTIPFPGVFAPGGAMWGGFPGMGGYLPRTNPRRTDEAEDGQDPKPQRSKLCRSAFCFGFNSKGHITQTTNGERERCLDFVDNKNVKNGRGIVFGVGDEVEVMLEMDTENCLKKVNVRVNAQPQNLLEVGMDENSLLSVAVQLVDSGSTVSVLEVTELSELE